MNRSRWFWNRFSLYQGGLHWLALPLTLAMAGCASVPLKEGGTLSSYGNLGVTKGELSKSRTFVDGQGLAAMKTVKIVPTTFASDAASRVKAKADRALVSNALDRELCVALSDKYEVVSAEQPADLTVRAVVTDLVPTDKAMAGVSAMVTLGTGVVLPVGVPRIPAGLGGLSVEAEAVDSSGIQRAAMVWARGANSIQNNPRVSEVGDAYSLASTFGSDFSRMLVTGKEPKDLEIVLPSGQRVQSWFGGKPKYAVCDNFGRSSGLARAVFDKIGAPPEWSDKRAEAATQ
ncbi:DUF3313 domain-containing protein [Ancylobacter dichloromethanicus]|uniref:DUF3313 domain-containing protein n=1 Tax=Ancylobacter dichloromethanicus TaxID=518825 RepID=A0A9W6JDN5_9HYPH|nr:DUF3313 domain-containing protein [Ancylobacter dichloromethanicus]MBS7552908.1 DUF3313 domain-containing protein [Ancylobacter dichloromethanicus]GLK74511.1 hypothetical protein GCM10017643_46290 [Ancylobacter dichloromethanicus]